MEMKEEAEEEKGGKNMTRWWRNEKPDRCHRRRRKKN